MFERKRPTMRPARRGLAICLSALFLALLPQLCMAGDWPMWRCDANRSASSPEELPRELHLQWVLELPTPAPCWPETQPKLQFDVSYEPVVMGKLLFVPSMVSDCVTAYDTETGEQKWRAYADGPVRFAPVAWKGKLYFVSDDGFLYCLNAATGKLLWKFRGGPSGHKVLGNRRLVSMWPARGAPVLYDGTVYFAASIWPFMGTFIHALDAETGKVVWTNSGSGSDFLLQPHSSPAFAGVAPQGYMVATEDRLLVAGGRSVPGVYDRRTGEFLYCWLNDRRGGYDVMAAGDKFINGGAMYSLSEGKYVADAAVSVFSGSALIGLGNQGRIRICSTELKAVGSVDRRGKKRKGWALDCLCELQTERAVEKVFIKAGSRIYCGGPGFVAAVQMPRQSNAERQAPHAKRTSGKKDSKPKKLIPQGSDWRYLAGSHPKGDWTAMDFDASAWKTGRAGFGYGDHDDATVLNDMRGKYTVVYIRKTFEADKESVPKDLGLMINYDDAFIAYLNGKEILRIGVGEGRGKNASKLKGHEATGHEFFPIRTAKLLRDGKNVLCIEGHNISLRSSDFSLDPYLATRSEIAVISKSKPGSPPVLPGKISWQTEIEGTPWSMLAADGKLFVVTKEGRIYCYGSKRTRARTHTQAAPARPRSSDKWTREAKRILDTTGVREGYCLVLGVGSGRLVEELVRASELRVIALDPDAGKIAALRRRLDAAGLYGTRASAFAGDVGAVRLPPYLAGLIVSEDLEAAGLKKGQAFVKRVFHSLRPYGGMVCFSLSQGERAAFENNVRGCGLENGSVEQAGGFTLLKRVGALSGSADWTHQYADAANSVMSKDKRVQAPLGLLWFGGPSHAGILPRHGHGPAPHVVGGRLFIEGPDILRAVDVYTGRVLWQRTLEGIGQYYNSTSHQAGANAIGSNYVSLEDGIYVAHGRAGLRLDPATGKTIKKFKIAPTDREQDSPEWDFVTTSGDVLIAAVRPLYFWQPSFSAGSFRRWKGKQVKKVVAAIRAWRDFKFVEKKGKENDKTFILNNLNKMIYEHDMLDKIPDAVKAKGRRDRKSAELKQQILAYLRNHTTLKKYDVGLAELNQQLLARYYGLPFEGRPAPGRKATTDRTASKRLVAMDRHSGKVLWRQEAQCAIRHNTIVCGAGKVFFIDRQPDVVVRRAVRRGLPVPDKARLVALDAQTGREVWSKTKNVFGTWLSYSAEHDLLVQAGSRAGDRALDEVGRRIIVYRAKDGRVLWDKDDTYSGPLIIHHDMLITQTGGGNTSATPARAFNLLTGEEITSTHPLTGETIPWTWVRFKGCNTAIASEHLLTFRSASACYVDLKGKRGTISIGGFKSGCTSNLIPANGVLNAPDYTRTCTCAYQNQTSLALVHMPENDVDSPCVEAWSFNAYPDVEKPTPVKRVGINLGAPGNRMARDGTLWLEYPSVGGPSPDVPISIESRDVKTFRCHTSRLASQPRAKAPTPLNWVAASGIEGEATITLRPFLQPRKEASKTVHAFDNNPITHHLTEKPEDSVGSYKTPKSYTVVLHFAEPHGLAAGQRVFDVVVQGKKVLENFDIAKEAGGTNQAVAREFTHVRVKDVLRIALKRSRVRSGAPTHMPVLCGIELRTEE
ncbi:MAG: PQQ-binding-like beta-propeller repeat protein [Planctomycetes bacterium]|nr:PQQ-binding-like beta-propeller repeat protein [Planctomycetota bacterium]